MTRKSTVPESPSTSPARARANEAIAVFEHPKIGVWCYPKRGIVHHQVLSPVLGDVFRKALTAGAEALRKHKGTRWLSDDRMNGALSPADFQWADEVWFDLAKQAGWRSWALLPPTTVIGQMNIQRHINLHKERGIAVEVFTDLEDGFRCLESV